nr:MAG TPA: hypothetical protein [Caudoviricetes sp.]
MLFLLFFGFQQKFSGNGVHVGIDDDHVVSLEFGLQPRCEVVVLEVAVQEVDQTDAGGGMLVQIARKGFQQEHLVLVFGGTDFQIGVVTGIEKQTAVPKDKMIAAFFVDGLVFGEPDSSHRAFAVLQIHGKPDGVVRGVDDIFGMSRAVVQVQAHEKFLVDRRVRDLHMKSLFDTATHGRIRRDGYLPAYPLFVLFSRQMKGIEHLAGQTGRGVYLTQRRIHRDIHSCHIYSLKKARALSRRGRVLLKISDLETEWFRKLLGNCRIVDFLHDHPHVIRQFLVRELLARLFQVGKFVCREADAHGRILLDVPFDTSVFFILVKSYSLTFLFADLDLVQDLLLVVELLERALLGQDDRNVEPVLDV